MINLGKLFYFKNVSRPKIVIHKKYHKDEKSIEI